MNAQDARAGEIVEASTAGFTAQCYQLFDLPALGSLVKTGEGDLELYAVVHHAATQGIEPNRKPVARGKDEASEQAIYDANPQLPRLLRSEFSALVVGFNQNGQLRQYLPPRPARIHSFVYTLTSEEMLAFSRRLSFISLLLEAEAAVPSEELTAAVLRRLAAAYADPRPFLVGAGKELAVLLGRDYARLKIILERIRP
jgi:hypothetical protein